MDRAHGTEHVFPEEAFPRGDGSPQLGFGTASLMSRVNRRTSVHLLETAFEQGIRHFDTGRSYGFGEAESVLGEVFAQRRDQVTFTTKVGILPPRHSWLLAGAKAVARGLIATMPRARAAVRQHAGTLVEAGQFKREAMERSLETSLRQLRTDHVDYLLLHEPPAAVLADQDTLDFLCRARQAGKARRLGIAATPEVVAHALRMAPDGLNVVQLSYSVFAPGWNEVSRHPGTEIMTHSALGPRFVRLVKALQRDAELASRWSEALGGDVRQPGLLAGLALRWSARGNWGGTVLFTSTQDQHIQQNAAAWRATASWDEAGRTAQLDTFQALVQSWMGTSPKPANHRSDIQSRGSQRSSSPS